MSYPDDEQTNPNPAAASEADRTWRFLLLAVIRAAGAIAYGYALIYLYRQLLP